MFYAIRHKPTSNFLPVISTGYRAGGTHVEPEADKVPRLFRRPQDALASVRQWARGKLAVHDHINFYGDHEQQWMWTTMPDRKLSDMEIVEVEITPVRAMDARP